LTGTGALVAGIGPAFIFPGRRSGATETLKILQWSHFVPDYKARFDGIYTKAWTRSTIPTMVEFTSRWNEIPARAAAEVAGSKATIS